ncbi:hypothetical protein [Caulobacter sp. BK020]|uniref:hypothetical protein n=1 Tax=Caulobacter sp. BK020 TaxID=2512117 RepID=UPI001042BD10|nr:hypothetical protein [Caulobacter sp. BK020]TCS15972.1 hypothetical protein EV278_104146 [Caulobacter sp. BK020]
MRPKMTWWRNLGGLLAACVLALLVVAPSVSMAACVCDGSIAPIASVETGMDAGQAVQADPRDHGATCEAACCVGGHCHHGGAMLDAPVGSVSRPLSTLSEHAAISAQALASRTLSGPDRPPRG